MEEGKFLGFIVTKDGFKFNPEKVQAIERMPSPSTKKEKQRLADRLAALNRFLANHAAKSYPFISTLGNCLKKELFQWTAEAESAFREMKECLLQLPTLTAPRKKEPLILYLSAADNAVGASRPAIKGQVLADFAAEVPVNRIQECEDEQSPTPPPSPSNIWALYTDGASNEDDAGAGLRLVSPNGKELTYAIRLDFKSTNNEAEYEALLVGLCLAVKLGMQHLEAHVDSLLVAGQVRGDYAVKRDIIILYLEQAKQLTSQFTSFNIGHINRSENKPADALSKLASTSFQHLAKEIRIEILQNPSVPLRQVNVIQYGTTSWMKPIIRYLQTGITPENKAEARKLQYKVCHYQMGDGPHMVVAKIMNIGYYWHGMHLDAIKIAQVFQLKETMSEHRDEQGSRNNQNNRRREEDSYRTRTPSHSVRSRSSTSMRLNIKDIHNIAVEVAKVMKNAQTGNVNQSGERHEESSAASTPVQREGMGERKNTIATTPLEGKGEYSKPKECTYKHFMSCKPQSLDGRKGALEAQDWLNRMESVLDICECDDRNKVWFAVHMFEAEALHWWNIVVRTEGKEKVKEMK
ncbi:uncharacterized protein LOC110893494 [Helianthus annuus]|uniref:uncharacterized protein LOC110893494 n=1 Tax=Helianthus annuus TaxID=4232 RepID=UPI000B8EE9F9|nr:uncharacterized protein LOC110893494 [Helianthus annuus]